MHTSKLANLPAGVNCKFIQLMDLQISFWVYTQVIKQVDLYRDI